MIADQLTFEQQWANLAWAIFRERPTIPVPRECVYFVRSGRYVKIGHSSLDRKHERISELQIGNPEPLDYLGAIRCWEAEPVERWLHYVLGDHRVRGEWFHFIPELAAYIEERALFRNPRRNLVALAEALEAER